MFQLIGLGEKAGSGFQKILRAWREQHWMIPLVSEDIALEMTRIWLPLASMIPADVERELRVVVGDSFSQLEELDRVILMLAHRFGEIGNADIQPYRAEHPRDVGDRLKFLVDHQWLERTGHGRGTCYGFPAAQPDLSAEVITGSGHYDAALFNLAAPVREKGRAPKGLVEQTIENLCADYWLSLRALAELLGRDADALRKHYVTRMVRKGKLEARFPGYPNHPDQAYKTLGKR